MKKNLSANESFENQIGKQNDVIEKFYKSLGKPLHHLDKIISAILTSVVPNLPEELACYLNFRLKHLVAAHGPWLSTSVVRDFFMAELAQGYGIQEAKAEKILTLLLDSLTQSKVFAEIHESVKSDAIWSHYCLYMFEQMHEQFIQTRGMGFGESLSTALESTRIKSLGSAKEFAGTSQMKLLKNISEIRIQQQKCKWYLDKYWISHLFAMYCPKFYTKVSQDFLEVCLRCLSEIGLNTQLTIEEFLTFSGPLLTDSSLGLKYTADELIAFFKNTDLVFTSGKSVFLTKEGITLSAKYAVGTLKENPASFFKSLPDCYQVETFSSLTDKDVKYLWSLRHQIKPTCTYDYLESLRRVCPDITFEVYIQQWLVESSTSKGIRCRIVEWIELNRLDSAFREVLEGAIETEF